MSYTEVTYFCRNSKCQKKVWTRIDVGAEQQMYNRETIVGHNHDANPIQREIDLIIDKALKMAKANPMVLYLSIVTIVLVQNFLQASNRMLIASATDDKWWTQPNRKTRIRDVFIELLSWFSVVIYVFALLC